MEDFHWCWRYFVVLVVLFNKYIYITTPSIAVISLVDYFQYWNYIRKGLIFLFMHERVPDNVENQKGNGEIRMSYVPLIFSC